jgi:hypothetical protein
MGVVFVVLVFILPLSIIAVNVMNSRKRGHTGLAAAFGTLGLCVVVFFAGAFAVQPFTDTFSEAMIQGLISILFVLACAASFLFSKSGKVNTDRLNARMVASSNANQVKSSGATKDFWSMVLLKGTTAMQTTFSVIVAIVLLSILLGKSVLIVPFGATVEYHYLDVFLKADHGGFRLEFVILLWSLVVAMLPTVIVTWMKKKLLILLSGIVCGGIFVFDMIRLLGTASSQGTDPLEWVFLLAPLLIAVLCASLFLSLRRRDML